MGMKKLEKVKKVTIKKQDRDGALYVTWWSPSAKKMMSERVESDNINTARRRAAEINAQFKKGNAARTEAHDRMPIRLAMDTAIAQSRSKDADHKQNLKDNIRYFIDWLSKAKPHIAHWDQINYDVLVNYIEYLRDVKKVSPKTAINYCTVIGMTSNFWSRKNPRLYVPVPVTHAWFADQPDPVKHFLTAVQALKLLDFAQKRSRRSNTGLIAVALGCFAGMNLQEIANAKVGWIEENGSIVHIRKSKNVARERKIPVIRLIQSILRVAVAGRDPDEYLIKAVGTKQAPTERTLSRNLDRHLLPAAQKALKCDNYDTVAPKDMRKTFGNLGNPAKVDRLYMEAYFGHAARTTFGKHYSDDTLVELLREHVTKKIEAYLQKVMERKPVEETPKVQLMPEFDELDVDHLEIA